MEMTDEARKAVALLAEGVDRNIGGNHIGAREIKESPSLRRAWIEIHKLLHTISPP